MRQILAALSATLLAACATTQPQHDPQQDLGLQWVKHAAEYRAITRQVYSVATRDLPRFIADTSWNALPQQRDAATLPPAVILDVDETVVSNVDFQLTLVPPFTNEKHDTWNRENKSTPVEGVKEFVEAARELGVTVFFVTNRPCRAKRDIEDPCPQRQTTIDDIREIGIETDADHVFLSEERGWTREKLSRRLHVAGTHRVIMLFGDDYGDFVECSRSSPAAPCTTAATRASRAVALDTYNHYWGNGWYFLPNPMHGSWTSVK
ncbi:MAG: hypothetical protein HKN77_02235 [Woeseiaceae bacterium]|nr:hypothetical protein [Woeseiaceae bacterium]